MSGFEWLLLIVVVILIPLGIAVAVTLWTLEMARQRNSRNRPGGKTPGVARRATRDDGPGAVASVSTDRNGLDRADGRDTDRGSDAGGSDGGGSDGGGSDGGSSGSDGGSSGSDGGSSGSDGGGGSSDG